MFQIWTEYATSVTSNAISGFFHFLSQVDILKPPLGFALPPALSQPAPLTDTLCFFFFFHPAAPVLGCQTPQIVTLLPSVQRNNSHCDKGSHNLGPGGPPHVQAGRSGLYFSRGQSEGVVGEQNKREYDGNFALFLFYVYMRCIFICNSSGIATTIYSAQRTLAQCLCGTFATFICKCEGQIGSFHISNNIESDLYLWYIAKEFWLNRLKKTK